MPVENTAYLGDYNPYRPHSKLPGISHRQDSEAMSNYAEKTGYFSSLLDLEQATGVLERLFAENLLEVSDNSAARLLEWGRNDLEQWYAAMEQRDPYQIALYQGHLYELSVLYCYNAGYSIAEECFKDAATAIAEELKRLNFQKKPGLPGGMNDSGQTPGDSSTLRRLGLRTLETDIQGDNQIRSYARSLVAREWADSMTTDVPIDQCLSIEQHYALLDKLSPREEGFWSALEEPRQTAILVFRNNIRYNILQQYEQHYGQQYGQQYIIALEAARTAIYDDVSRTLHSKGYITLSDE
jgi:hypothetical protein